MRQNLKPNSYKNMEKKVEHFQTEDLFINSTFCNNKFQKIINFFLCSISLIIY